MSHRNRKWILSGAVAVALLFIFFVSRIVQHRTAGTQRLNKLQKLDAAQDKDSKLASIFLNATKVEAFRMKPMLGYAPEPTIGKLGDFEYSAKRSNIDRSIAVRVGALVMDPGTYTGEAKACAFNPTVAFRVWKGHQWINVVICLGCNQLIVIESDPKVPVNSIGSATARFRIGGQFDDYRAEFLELAREAFPQDAYISSLE